MGVTVTGTGRSAGEGRLSVFVHGALPGPHPGKRTRGERRCVAYAMLRNLVALRALFGLKSKAETAGRLSLLAAFFHGTHCGPYPRKEDTLGAGGLRRVCQVP